ncbi:MAG: bifunctional UDP-N-acetylmuramoyl-tripeptide:D-alanyl-D-alanine ligase/alanine racemase [Phaeodactylibacter sp.]|nr:bifunctional UDP-N-acetylmuramoyl-tripeptide:D-alanyl-D-alanine ligase/alanine racemase [Phaeodactylibacter sp.]
MKYTFSEIQRILQAELLQQKNPEAAIQQLCLDSRQVPFPKESLFFAVTGPMHDGHQFLAAAYHQGVRNFVVSKRALPHLPGGNILLVEDTVQSLQKLADHHRHQFDLPVIGITGSNGKTIVKEWLDQCLSPDLKVVRSPRSYNSQVGVPLSLWQMSAQDQLGIFEAGISKAGEMARIAPLIDCSIGLFTNIGDAHAAGFAGLSEKIQEKLALFEHAQILVYCRDHKAIHEAVAQRFPFKKTFQWSIHNEADLRLAPPLIEDANALLEAQVEGQHWQVRLPFTDRASIENAIHCWAVLLVLKYPMPLIKRRLESLEPVAMRMELKAGVQDCTLINDTYNADLASLKSALQFLEQQEPDKERIVIISDILENSLHPSEMYREVAGLLQQHQVNRLYGIGEAIRQVSDYLPNAVKQQYFNTATELLQELQPPPFHSAVLLIKGARRFELERITRRLEAKDHQTVLEVDLNALRHNLQTYTQVLNPRTKTLVMVKADAYGSGAVKVARLMEYQQVDYLGVAYADEGVALRQAGIELPILVLNPGSEHFDSIIRYRLEPEIYSLRQLQHFLQHLSGRSTPFPIHLKLETGMHRLGFEAEDMDELAEILQRHRDRIQVASLFTHLSASENPEEDSYSHQQADLFLQYSKLLSEALGYQPIRHVLNSSGILRFPEYHLEMVRLGIGLYGFDSAGQIQGNLQSVLTFKAGISQIKDLEVGETVGYSRKGLARQPMRIATISTGYADGLLRLAGNGRFKVLIRGQEAPTVGNICMDMSMVDVSHIPEVAVGDEVLLFGAAHPVTALAEALQTIPYEVFTNISERVKRVYVQE